MSEAVRWYRVFGVNDGQPAPEALLAALSEAGLSAEAAFTGDDLGWYAVKLRLPERDEPVEVQRFVAGADDIRGDLNTWAAWVETQTGCDLAWLMQHLVSTAQLFVWFVPEDDARGIALSAALCDFFSRATGGVYQVDGHGFYDVAGTHLVREAP
jgi:hypothetical protein